MYNIAQHGDPEEKRANSLFLQKQFPHYEVFWSKFVVGLTNRPNDIFFKDDKALTTDFPAETNARIHERLCIAQLHYSVLMFLLTAHDARATADKSYNSVSQVLSALYSAIDISSELFARYGVFKKNNALKRDAFDPKSIEEAIRLRRFWVENNPYPNDILDVRDYRNILIHGRIIFWGRTPTGYVILPQLGQCRNGLDWRVAISDFNSGNLGNYIFSQHLVESAFDIVIKYLNDAWESHLIKS
jgi:hypothetical protein